MQVKKAGGKVYGAILTAAEKKAMDLEIQRELAEYDRKHIAEIDATILWVLHEQFGFGAQRLQAVADDLLHIVHDLAILVRQRAVLKVE